MNVLQKGRPRFIAGLLLAALFLWLAAREIDAREVLNAAARIPLHVYIAALLVSFIASVLIPARITRDAARTSSVNASLAKFVSINLALRFYIYVLPRPVVIGLRWVFYRAIGRGDDSFALMAFERVAQLFAVAALLLAAILCVEKDRAPAGLLPSALLLAVVAVGISLLLVACFFSVRLFHGVTRIAGPFIRLLPEWLREKFEKLFAAIRRFHDLKGRTHASIYLLNFVVLGMLVLSDFMLVRALQTELPLPELVLMRLLVFLVSSLPLTPGGLGVREGSTVAFMVAFGVAADSAFAFALAVMSIQLAIAFIGGLHELVRVYRTQRPAS
jgi:glycosyltransferase 2 family protein